ncbi:MAG: replication restart helicase PriA [Oligoflexus sp.]
MVQELNDKVYLKVAVPTQVGRLFTYGAEQKVPIGARVQVPFGQRNRPTIGVVLGHIGVDDLDFDPARIKNVVEIIDEQPVYRPALIELAQWMADYYWYPLGEVLRAMLPSSGQSVKKQVYRLHASGSERNADPDNPEGTLLRWVFGRFSKLGAATVKKKLQSWPQGGPEAESLWQKLGREGYWQLEEDTKIKARKTQQLAPSTASKAAENALSFTPAQAEVFAAIKEKGLGAAIETRRPFLLWGVTGAGKTEIYLQLIAEVLSQDEVQQALVMVPEISLTPQMTRVFEARFPNLVAVVHSAMSDPERWAQLDLIRQGQAKILVGPRSSIFAPFGKLALIIVDEEHDSSYKQTSGLCYHGRDVAVVRAKLEGAVVVLGSATPSMESFWNAHTGKYHLLRLSERVHGRPLPETTLVAQKIKRRTGVKLPKNAEDLLADIPISEQIIEELEATIARGEQAMVIVNRRGFAFYLFSLDRQEPVQCPHCSVSLTVHKKSRILRCHYCDYHASLSQIQTERQGESLVTVGYGSEQAEDFLNQKLPGRRIVRVDSDTVQKKDALSQVLKDFREGRIDVLVGTQILAKGHDFAKVTLICLLEVDQSLNLPDFRAGERTFQLMVQASGRAGRGDLAGRVMVQCQKADHPVILAALRQDYVQFTKMEIGFREVHGYPPFSRMVLFELNGPDRDRLEKAADTLKELTIRYFTQQNGLGGVNVLGPAVPPIEMIRGRHRRTMIISGTHLNAVRRLTAFVREQLTRLPKDVRLKIDIDPQSIL